MQKTRYNREIRFSAADADNTTLDIHASSLTKIHGTLQKALGLISGLNM